jgi:hypothetical protein
MEEQAMVECREARLNMLHGQLDTDLRARTHTPIASIAGIKAILQGD